MFFLSRTTSCVTLSIARWEGAGRRLGRILIECYSETASVICESAVETPHFVRRDVLHDIRKASPVDRADFRRNKPKSVIRLHFLMTVIRNCIYASVINSITKAV
jgi:hypothetical protein